MFACASRFLTCPLCLVCLFVLRVEMRGEAAEFLSNSYSPLALVGVRVCSQYWDDFASEYIAGDKYLNDVSPGDGAGAVVDFVLFLLNDLLLTNAAVRHHLTNLRAVFVIGRGQGDIFDSGTLTATRRVLNQGSESPDMVVMEPQVLGATQLPFTVDMLARMRDLYWEPGDINRRMIYVAVATMLFRGMRVSQVANTGSSRMAQGGSDHRYRVMDITLETAETFVSVEEWVAASYPTVNVIKLCCRSSKTHGKKKAKKTIPPIVLFRDVGSTTEQQFFYDLLAWIPLSGRTLPGDLLFSRTSFTSSAETKMLMSCEVAAAVKDIAVQFGFTGKQHSTRSVRIGANMEHDAQGATDGERMAVLDHTSLSSNLKYLRPHVTGTRSTFSQDGALAAATVLKKAKYT